MIKSCHFLDGNGYFIRVHLGYSSLLKGSLSTFIFVDWFNNHLGCCGSPSDGCDRVWTAKVLPDVVEDVGSDKNIFNLLKSKLKKGKAEEDKEKQKKGKEIQLKVRKSSLKRFGANTINCVC